jgi:predicted regulator of Ras-like GTPase activity (Roadblock/LC7/MglB family)
MFQSILVNMMSRIRGARWAMLVATDGVLLESYPHDLPDADDIAADKAELYRSMRRSVAAGGSSISTATLRTSGGKLLFQDLTPDYFLLVNLAPDGHAGRASFEIARTRQLLERELVF